MSSNWILVDQIILAERHQELLKAAQEARMASQLEKEKGTILFAKALSSLGDRLIQIGFWLQDRSGHLAGSRSLEIDDRLWGSKPKAPAC
jgi:hypothetical protein